VAIVDANNYREPEARVKVAGVINYNLLQLLHALFWLDLIASGTSLRHQPHVIWLGECQSLGISIT
jgi:hypothetical protein